jgi:cytochrome c1
MRTLLAAGLVAGACAAFVGLAIPAAASTEIEAPRQDWSFSGIFGTFDRASLQRGWQVYREVCSACHSLKFIAFRDLEGIGLTEDQVAAIANEFEVQDGPNDEGEMYTRKGRPSDHIPPPFPNDQAARAANNGALPPDLSLITEARPFGMDALYKPTGADYVDALMQGFRDPPPAGFKLNPGMFYNEYFPGHQIAMPPPLSDDRVTYADGTKATLAQEAHDITTFLSWAAQPHMEARKTMGVKVILFLIVLTAFLYATKRKIWSDAH